MTTSQATLQGRAPARESVAHGFAQRLATPLTTGLFAVSALSGIALFFHWAPGAFHAMHEWLSILLLAPVALHLWKNWRPLLAYGKRGTLLWPLALCAVLVVPFAAMSGGTGGGNPAFRAIPLLTQARVSDLAPILNKTPEQLAAALRERGYTVGSEDETLTAIAAASGKPADQALVALLPSR